MEVCGRGRAVRPAFRDGDTGSVDGGVPDGDCG